MGAYLTSAPVIGTRSLEEARDAVTRVYLPHVLEGPTDAINMTLNAVTDRRMTLGYLTYGAETELTMPATQDCYHVNLTVVGETRASRSDGGRERTAPHLRGVVLSPVQENRVRWRPDAEQLILKIPRASLESHLGGVLGRTVNEVVDFDFGLDLTSGPGQALLRSVLFLASELDHAGTLERMPVAREQLESYVMTALLHAGRHQFSDALAGREDDRRLGRIAPVVRHIEDHPDSEITPEVLARIGCMSVRTLQALFHEQLGETPMTYVRRVRMARVREELLAGDCHTTCVTDVAMRYGFFHQSRFAQRYRAQFDELPSATLRR